ncbi:MAG: glpgli family protein [Muribaculaceae bacterium]|nr:glpgli family protein [Muribaculaceae bacterium]
MKRYIIIALALIISMPMFAKKAKVKGYEISYTYNSRGTIIGAAVMTFAGSRTMYVPDAKANDPRMTLKAPEQRQYVDFDQCKSMSRAVLQNGDVVTSESAFTIGANLTDTGKTEKILGYDCRCVHSVVNSNHYDIWYTTQLPVRGTPQPGVGVPDGLVLRVVRNQNQVEEATSIKPLKAEPQFWPEDWGKTLNRFDYQYAIKQSVVVTVPIFDQERICFNGAKLPEGELEAGKTYACGGGTVIIKKVKLPELHRGWGIFADVTQYSEGDAYDRTGSVFVIPMGKEKTFIDAIRKLDSTPYFESGGVKYHGLVSTPAYDVPVELMRFFTGFGVRFFNDKMKIPGQEWVDSVFYKSQVTPLQSHLQGEVWIGAYIGNWDSRGHRVSLKLKYFPDDLRHKLYDYENAIPLFNTVNYLEQDGQPYPLYQLGDSLKVTFTLDHDVKNAHLLYTTTGHGGWGGGDEFLQKPNTIYLDGVRVVSFIPWRDDCGTYRNFNPQTGMYETGCSSSDMSRSNWCPGTVTNPNHIPLGNLSAGTHTIEVQIPQGEPEGGSNSYWCISGTLLY